MSVSILKTIWGKNSGYVFVPRRKDKVWDEGDAYKYPDDWEKIKERIVTSAKAGWDTYWCPLLFSTARRLKECAVPTASILWADLDYVNPTTLGALKPSIAWKSSDERYQALWLLDAEYDLELVESTNRDLTYKIGADKGGWDVTQVLRVPGSPNYKYTPPQQGKLLWAENRRFNLNSLRSAVTPEPSAATSKALEVTLDDLLAGWKIPARVHDLLYTDPREVEVGDRSDRLWEIETSLVEAGLPVLTVVDIIRICPWNKFKGRKGEREQIHNEVLKAEKHVKTRDAKAVSDVTSEEEKVDERLATQWAIPFAEFTAKRMEKPEWLVEGIWQKGTYGMIAGEPKTYKSVQATDLALSVASGRAFLNHFPVNTTGTVLYVQEENNEQTVQDRVFKIASSKGLLTSTPYGWQLPNDLPIYFSNNYGINLTEKRSRELLENTIKELKPVLVILDPLYMMLGSVDENSATEVGDVLRWITRLRNVYGCAIVVCHHYNKGTNGTSVRAGQRVRGSSAFHAWVESAIYVKATTELFTVKLEREFRAFPTMPELTVKLELGNPGDLTYRPQVIAGADLEAKAELTLIKAEEMCTLLSDGPKNESELMKLCKLGMAEAQRAINYLLDTDKIMKVSGGGRGYKTTYALK